MTYLDFDWLIWPNNISNYLLNNALKTFHAVARHESMRGAADELLVTLQAVNQQIKLLEDILQVNLTFGS
ncbi:MAG: LysR family transcriptional regulator, partial [Rhodobacteraceae bacterium]|nr:LysR family transcriptional regulator [Paracoccaceae bacterium]